MKYCMKHLLNDYHQYVLRVRRKTLSNQARSSASINEHRMIMEAIIAKDADKAEQLANMHILNAFDNIVKNGLYEVYATKSTNSDDK